MNATTLVKLAEINPSLICRLCQGYLIDASTIIECQHSFCKSCIVKHLKDSEYCPVCDVQLHASNPLNSVRSDQMLQEIVYKLVPGLFKREMERRREFYKNHPQVKPVNPTDAGEVQNYCYISSIEDMQIRLELCTPDNLLKESTRRFMKCKAGVSILLLKKLLAQKYEMPVEAGIEILYGERKLPDDFLLMDVAYKYSWNQMSDAYLPLYFSVQGDPKLFQSKKISSWECSASIDAASLMGKLKKALNQKKDSINRKKQVVPFNAANLNEIRKRKKSHLAENASIKLVKPPATAKLNGITPHLPKKGRPRKIGLPELPRIEADLQQKEVQLTISEKGVISAIDPLSGLEKIIASGHAETMTDAVPKSFKENGSAFPQIDPLAVFSGMVKKSKTSKVPKVIPNGVIKSGSDSITKKKNAVAKKMTEAAIIAKPLESLKKTKLPMALGGIKKPNGLNGTPKISKNMQALQGVTRKIQEEPPEHYFAAELLPLTSPPSNTKLSSSKLASVNKTPICKPLSNGPVAKEKNSPARGIKRQHSTPIINGDVRFTPQTAKKLLSSPKSKLSSTEISPKKPSKFFKSREQLNANGPTSSPLCKSAIPVADAGVTPKITSANGSQTISSSKPSLPHHHQNLEEELPDIDPVLPQQNHQPILSSMYPGTTITTTAGNSPAVTVSNYRVTSTPVSRPMQMPNIPYGGFLPYLGTPQFCNVPYMSPAASGMSLQQLYQAGMMCAPEIMQSFQVVQNSGHATSTVNSMNASDFSRFFPSSVTSFSPPISVPGHPVAEASSSPKSFNHSAVSISPKGKRPGTSTDVLSNGHSKTLNASPTHNPKSHDLDLQNSDSLGAAQNTVKKGLARLYAAMSSTVTQPNPTKAPRKSSSPSKRLAAAASPATKIGISPLVKPPPATASPQKIQPSIEPSSATEDKNSVTNSSNKLADDLTEVAAVSNICLRESASRPEDTNTTTDASKQCLSPTPEASTVTSTTEATNQKPEPAQPSPSSQEIEPSKTETEANSDPILLPQSQTNETQGTKEENKDDGENQVSSTIENSIHDDCDGALTIVIDKEEDSNCPNDQESTSTNVNNNEILTKETAPLIPSPTKNSISNSLCHKPTEEPEIASTATSA